MDHVMDLWENKRWLFWLLFPVIAVIVGLHFFMSAKANSIESSVANAEKKDDQIKAKEVEIKIKEAVIETKIEAVEARIGERKVEEIPLDWNKNFKPSDDK